MSEISILGAGAFGTALAIALGDAGSAVTLWGRDAAAMSDMAQTRENARHLPGAPLPDSVAPTEDLAKAGKAEVILLSVPMQQLRPFLAETGSDLRGKILVGCCKGMDLTTGQLVHEIIAGAVPGARPAILSGPSFAADIAQGLPTALTLAIEDHDTLQERLSTRALRLYSSTDLTGVALGGALKNVVAIACGTAIGAGLGESARAALMTRGFAEMTRYAARAGADPETLAGLSGFGDLALTCTSEKSRNFRFGVALGQSGKRDTSETTEGIATAQAILSKANESRIEMPVTRTVADLTRGAITVDEAVKALLSRPLTSE